MAIEGLQISLMSCEAIMDGHLAAARLVQHGHLHTVAEAGGAVAKDDIDVLDEAVVGDIVVGDIVLDVFDAAVVADGDVVQRGVEDARVLVDTAGHIEALRETADADVTREAGVTDISQTLFVGNLHARPIVGAACLRFQKRNLGFSKCSHI